jgi:hypothetical protein
VSGTRSPVDVVRRRVAGTYEVDEWGYDADLVDLLDPLLGVAWRVTVHGAERIPAEGPALVLANRRVGVIEPLALARGIRRSSGRRLRFLGIPDVSGVGPALRRIGGAIARPDELSSLLRAGHLCTLPLSRARRRVAGTVAPEALLPAFDAGAPVLPAAIVGREVTGAWEIFVGSPLDPPAGRGPLALAELAEAAHDGVQALLDEAFPPRWLFG